MTVFSILARGVYILAVANTAVTLSEGLTDDFALLRTANGHGTDGSTFSSQDTTTPQTNSSTDDPGRPGAVDTWSIMWYLISFGGLILFFLLVSFSEVCCKRIPFPFGADEESAEADEVASPPSYELFAPPTYESLFSEKKGKKKNRAAKKKLQVFVVPVDDKPSREVPLQQPVEFGEVISRNSMGDGEVVTPPPPP